MKVALTCVDVNANCEPVFKFKVYNTCQQSLSNIAFQLPVQTTGTDPVQGDTYVSPCGDSWNVETPTSGPDAGTIKFEGQLGNGESTCFEFVLHGLTKIPDVLTVNPKYGPNEVFLHIPTYACGNATVVNIQARPDKVRTFGCVGLGICRVYQVEYDCPLVASGRFGCEAVIMRADDETPPVYDFVPSDLVLACDDPIVFDPPTATDDCGAVSIESLGNQVILGGCPNATVYIRRWKARDDCFNYAYTIQQKLTVPASCCTMLAEGIDERELSDVSLSLHMRISPNPVSEVLYIEVEGVGDGNNRMRILDLQGKQVFQQDFSHLEVSEIILHTRDLNLPDGLFFVELSSGEQTIIQKVMLKR
ncbi:MAG: T9SS type A sorting domain-containing protein [Bacteroidetes bacterium]|nr:T9SS type A sorting domain-containing protein [Bacteroidota bacterium]